MQNIGDSMRSRERTYRETGRADIASHQMADCHPHNTPTAASATDDLTRTTHQQQQVQPTASPAQHTNSSKCSRRPHPHNTPTAASAADDQGYDLYTSYIELRDMDMDRVRVRVRVAWTTLTYT
jgi:hypothetical protein